MGFYKVQILKRDGGTHDLPNVKERGEAAKMAELATQMPLAHRVLVFESKESSYPSDWILIADIPGKSMAHLPDSVPEEIEV